MVDMRVTADVKGLDAAIQKGGRKLEREMVRTTTKHAYMGQAFVKRNARGRPGPNVITGDYNRQINIRFHADGSATVGTNAVQSRRLEKGFEDTDSLGRVYHQRAYEHFGPAERQLGPIYQRAALQTIADSF